MPACSVTSVMSDSCDPMDCSPPGSSVHGISQARILEWVPLPTPGFFPTQESNLDLLCLLHCRWIHYHLSHLELRLIFFFLIRASLVFVSGTQVPGAFDFLICKAYFAQGLSLVLFQNDCALIFLSQEEWTVGDHTNKFKWEAVTIA